MLQKGFDGNSLYGDCCARTKSSVVVTSALSQRGRVRWAAVLDQWAGEGRCAGEGQGRWADGVPRMNLRHAAALSLCGW